MYRELQDLEENEIYRTENDIKLYLFIPAYDVERDIRYIPIRK